MSTAKGPLLLLSLLLALSAGPAHAGDPEAWRAERPEQPEAVLIQGATLWTSGPQGILEEADLLVRRGKIAALGPGLEVPRGAVVVDGRGKHVTPGLVDAHSHIAIDGGVNETSRTITAEVRIQDVLDPSDIALYRQLAGGVTTSHLLHGSANAIGGQSAVIKLRWGAAAEELLFEGAPAGIKLALGENPRKVGSRSPKPNHFPATRPGVEQLMRERFTAALDYRRRWREHGEGKAARGAPPPRRDLQLEALVEVLEGRRQVHAHSYRADEILMLLALAEDFGFKIAVLQHAFEAYKVADEIAAHGAAISTSSDWWAYKYEVVDAIPFNAALAHERGVLVSLSSDSGELGRRLNLEAAKTIRYGGMEPQEALKMVTANPAIQLGVGDRIGTLEPGKDADFVLWSASPLSTVARCEQTWIDGRRYFDRQEDLLLRQALAAERQALMAKARAEGDGR